VGDNETEEKEEEGRSCFMSRFIVSILMEALGRCYLNPTHKEVSYQQQQKTTAS
jgi:hypothetical protein